MSRRTAVALVGVLGLAGVLASFLGSHAVQLAGIVVLAIVLLILLPDLIAPGSNLLRPGGRPRFFRTRNPPR